MGNIVSRKEWEKLKQDCEYFTGSFWKRFEYCWHTGWKDELRATGKVSQSSCRWCDYDWCPMKEEMYTK